MSRVRIAVIVVGIASLGAIAGRLAEDHERFLQWQAKQDAWKAKCSQYIDQPVSRASPNPAQEACQREFDALFAEAKAHGWMK